MNFPPLLMRLDVSGQRRRLSLWLPLFLVWLFLAALAIALLPLILIALLVLGALGWGKLFFFSGWPLVRVLCALRGLEVDLELGNRLLLISFK